MSAEEITFVLCIEQNAIRAQALVLCESIRAFGGRHQNAPIVAVAPRAGLGVDTATQAALRALDVEYVEASLNQVCPVYGSANRVFAASWVESRARSEWIVVLDSDTLVFGDLDLPADVDVCVRPVDTKGSATSGDSDPFDSYWRDLAACQGTTVDALPWLTPSDASARIRASYNAGLVITRRSEGLLAEWASLFERSVTAGLKPWRGSGLNVHASTGMVGVEASEFWGSNQAALALTIWARSRRVHVLSNRYNIPLHMIVNQPHFPTGEMTGPPVHVHYHWLLQGPEAPQAVAALEGLGISDEQSAWLRSRAPLSLT